MKKIINWYKSGWTKINPIGKWMVMFVVALLCVAIIYPEHGVYWAVGSFLGFMTIVIWNGHMEYSIQKKQKEFLEKKHGDDPDWETYKKLKSKFKGV